MRRCRRGPSPGTCLRLAASPRSGCASWRPAAPVVGQQPPGGEIAQGRRRTTRPETCHVLDELEVDGPLRGCQHAHDEGRVLAEVPQTAIEHIRQERRQVGGVVRLEGEVVGEQRMAAANAGGCV